MSAQKVDRDKLRQATLLAQAFDPSLIQRKPGNRGADYVSHPVVQQRFMFVTGAPETSIVREIYGAVKGKPDLGSVLVGVLMRMEVTVDGKLKWSEEFGSCEHPENEMHDGERAKKAASDAYKRCAMRIAGVGLHLWCKNGYTLGDRMIAQDMKEDADLVESNATDDESDERSVVALAPKSETDEMFARMKALPADRRKRVWTEFLTEFGDLAALPAVAVDSAWNWILKAEDPPDDVDAETGEILGPDNMLPRERASADTNTDSYPF